MIFLRICIVVHMYKEGEVPYSSKQEAHYVIIKGENILVLLRWIWKWWLSFIISRYNAKFYLMLGMCEYCSCCRACMNASRLFLITKPQVLKPNCWGVMIRKSVVILFLLWVEWKLFHYNSCEMCEVDLITFGVTVKGFPHLNTVWQLLKVLTKNPNPA